MYAVNAQYSSCIAKIGRYWDPNLISCHFHFDQNLGSNKIWYPNFPVEFSPSDGRQVCKDKVPAPSDLVRSEVEMLRSLEHPAIPQAQSQ